MNKNICLPMLRVLDRYDPNPIERGKLMHLTLCEMEDPEPKTELLTAISNCKHEGWIRVKVAEFEEYQISITKAGQTILERG